MELTNFEKTIEEFISAIVEEFIYCDGRLNERQKGDVDGSIATLEKIKSIATSNDEYDYWVRLLRDEES